MDDSEGNDAKTGARSERQTQLPEAPPAGQPSRAAAPSVPPPARSRRTSAPPGEVRRPSAFDALRQSETTLFEVGKVAERLSVVALGRADAGHLVRQVVISFALGLTLA